MNKFGSRKQHYTTEQLYRTTNIIIKPLVEKEVFMALIVNITQSIDNV